MNLYNRRGFTLVELLVVIAIIAILAAILFPVFSRVREHAKQVTCASNLKQIAMGLIQYCAENEGFGPVIRYDAVKQRYISPLQQLEPYNLPYFHGLSEHVGNPQVNPIFLCKSGRRVSTYMLPWYGGGQGYWNYPGQWNIDRKPYLNSYATIHYTPADAMMVADCMGDPLAWAQTDRLWYGHHYMFLTPKADGTQPMPLKDVYLPHPGGSMMAFRDGHVALVGKAELWDPDTPDWWLATEE